VKQLEGRVAVVTGAAGGIGLTLCERFAAEGMRVVMADVDPARLETAADGLGADVLAVPTDASRWDGVAELARRARERFGAVHVLCNNAGVTRPGPLWEADVEEWEWVLAVNLSGVFHGVKAFVPAMIERGEPAHVVNTASIGGLLAYPGLGAYAAAKYGVVGLSESLLHDLRASGAPIGVSVLCPGPVATDFRAHSRALRPGGPQEDVSGEYDGVARIPPAEVAAQVVDAIRADRFWIVTHPEYHEAIERRARGIVETDDVVEPAIPMEVRHGSR
jgi:NAD(P)-dependent dehydrogenase (short-subunit alcohol dehydrogenase family)